MSERQEKQLPAIGRGDVGTSKRSGRGFLRCAVILAFATVATGGARAQDAGAEWTTPAGSVQGTRFSSLAQINDKNVSSLREEFAFSTGIRANHEGGPLVVGDTMYVVTPYPNKLYAFDLNTPGKIRWVFKPKISEYAKGVACCDVVNRGAVYAAGKIIFNLLDNSTVAVDARTGRQVWRTKNGDPATGQTITMSPLVVKNKVLIGNSGAELGIRGWVSALDVNTGRRLWKAYNTGPDADVKIGPKFKAFYPKDQGKDLGSTSWGGTTLWQQGGSTAWSWYTYDPDLNLFYYGTANPGVWNPDMRPGDNKWGATIFARNPDTGEAVWAYQVTPHDEWDYDAISESIVATLTINGLQRKVIVHFDKNGFGYTLDAATGEILVAKPYVKNITWATGIDLLSGEPAVNLEYKVHEGASTKNICPATFGGKDWEPSAFSPSTGLFYVPAINLCNELHALKANFIAGTPFMGIDIAPAPAPGGYGGELIAWDAATGERRWSNPEGYAVYSGVLATAGNLVFYGTLDKKFKALDATTGKELFAKQLECGIVGNPVTFMGPDGKQRVAIYTGVGWLAGLLGPGPCPSESDKTGKAGVHVFKLP